MKSPSPHAFINNTFLFLYRHNSHVKLHDYPRHKKIEVTKNMESTESNTLFKFGKKKGCHSLIWKELNKTHSAF